MISKSEQTILVLGGGITGLTAAWELLRTFPGRVVLLEKEASVGGLATTSHTADRFAFDVGSHRLHSDNDPAVNHLIRDLCGPELLERNRNGRIFIQDRPFRYPPSAFDIMSAFGLKDFLKFGLGLLRARMVGMSRRAEPENYEDYTTSKVGKPLYERFYKPYATKLYGMSPRGISKDPAVSRVRKFESRAMLREVRSQIGRKQRRTYLYPAQGIGQLATSLQKRFLENGGQIHHISRIDAIRIKDDSYVESVVFQTHDGTTHELETQTFVSTISLDALHHMVRLETDADGPPEFDLRWRGLRLLYLVTSDKIPSTNETYYFPESHIPFGRVSEIKKYSPALDTDSARTLLTIEIPCSPGDDTWNMADNQLADICIAGLQKLGIVRNPTDGAETAFSRKLDKVYPVYDLGWKARFERIYQRLNQLDNLYMIGRGALFLHCNIDHCMLMAIKLSQHLADAARTKDEWEALRQGFLSYRVRE